MGDAPENKTVYQQIFLQAESAVAIVGGAGLYVDHNEAHRGLVGYTLEELEKLGPEALFGVLVWGQIRGAIQESGRDTRTATLSKRSGESAPVELSSFSCAPGSTIVFVRDLTRDVEQRSRLRSVDRLASLGMLIAGIAHEVNNPIAYVIACLQFAGRELGIIAAAQRGAHDESIEQVRSAIAEAEAGVSLVKQLSRALTRIAHPEDEAIELVDVRAPLDRAIAVAKSELRHRARLEREYLQVPFVRANSGRLQQVFLNLLINAAHAIPEGSVEHNLVRAVVRDQDANVVIEIQDTGSGILPENSERIFEAFFTTKPESHGTGLGLTISRDIVRSFGGELSFTSIPGEGSTFRVVLPATVRPETPRRPIRVLIVDDERKIGESFQLMLEPEHEVTAATTVDEAVAKLTAGEPYEVIFCDVMMPGGGGPEFHARISQVMPQLLPRIVYITGGAFTPEARSFLESIPNRRLTKPLDPAVLAAIILELRTQD